MRTLNIKSVFTAIALLVLIAGYCPAQADRAPADGLRIEMPSGGNVRVENQFGEIAAEVWQEKYISVSTTK